MTQTLLVTKLKCERWIRY